VKPAGPLWVNALGIELVVRPDPEAAAKMAGRWQEPNSLQVRQCQRAARKMCEVPKGGPNKKFCVQISEALLRVSARSR